MVSSKSTNIYQSGTLLWVSQHIPDLFQGGLNSCILFNDSRNITLTPSHILSLQLPPKGLGEKGGRKTDKFLFNLSKNLLGFL